MCGIAGFYSVDGIFDRDQLKQMTDSIKYRGPDSEGDYFNGNCGLGHRRLSIIDLSDRASQPMFSADKRYVIVYNGEVYNYTEIGAKLGITGGVAKKTVLRSSSDTK
ncbi:MAG: hypothetical protein IPP71_21645 [Bacteroidetes bacterium]|nr:hypothetical protein [Bacteroidota bacterium]